MGFDVESQPTLFGVLGYPALVERIWRASPLKLKNGRILSLLRWFCNLAINVLAIDVVHLDNGELNSRPVADVRSDHRVHWNLVELFDFVVPKAIKVLGLWLDWLQFVRLNGGSGFDELE